MSSLSYQQLGILTTEWASFQDCPSSLKNFFARASVLSRLAEHENSEDSPVNIQATKNIKGIKPKKLHELTNFSQLIREECGKQGADRVVDVGCGLGHMLNFLNKSETGNAIQCEGIETNEKYCCSAKKKYGDSTNVNCVRFAADDDQVTAILSEKDRKTALISLHGCGDLQPMLLKEFIRLQHINDSTPLLLTIGCCYHKMRHIDRWPMSSVVRLSLSKQHNAWRPTLSAFRLACQQRISSWKAMTEQEHECHKQSFINRAIAECFYKEMGINGADKERGFNRKLGNTQEEMEAIILKRNNISCLEKAKKWRLTFRQIYAQHQKIAKFVEPFTALQFALQGVLERLLLWDRVFYLREHGAQAHLKAVFNSQLSPRNMCVVGIRDSM